MSDVPPRSRLPRWLKRSIIALLVTINLGVFLVYFQLRAIEDTVDASVKTIPDIGERLTPRAAESADPVTFLLVGSDSRATLESTEGFGNFEGQRSDVVMLVKIHPDESRAQILSLPRDLWVDIPGNGTAKINAAYAIGGASLLVDTVKQFSGVDINHYVEVDLAGFQAIVDQLGGVLLDFEHPARDVKSHLDVPGSGEQRLDGFQALAYARSRSYQELIDGSWVTIDGDDFGRTARQQRLIVAILEQMTRPSTLTEASHVVRAFSEHVSMDAALADSSMVELAFRMRGLAGGDVERATLPGVGDNAGGQYVILPQEPEASQMLAAFRRGDAFGEAEEIDPLAVVVLNGNGIVGNASLWSDQLAASGFSIESVADADNSDYTDTLVLVREGDEQRASLLIDALGFGTVEVGAVPEAADAVVVLGADAA